MGVVSKNIRFLRNTKGLTQEKFSEELGIKRSLLGAYEEGRSNPNYKVLLKLCEMFNISMEEMLNKDLSEKIKKELDTRDKEKIKNFLIGNTRLLTITVNEEGDENIEIVSQKACAGYLSGYADEEFIRELPKFRLPFLHNGTFRAFEIQGDSMLPVQPGSIIIGEYIDKPEDIRDGSAYIILSKNDGIVYKRLFKSDDEPKIYLHSDNKAYQPYAVHPGDILEVWKAILVISKPDNQPGVSMEQLMTMIVELQNEVIRLKTTNQA